MAMMLKFDVKYNIYSSDKFSKVVKYYNNNNNNNNNNKRENMHTDRCGNNRGQKCCAKGSGKEVKV